MAKSGMVAGPRRLGPLITRIARKSAGRRGLPTAEILANWRSIVGPDLAPLTVPERVTFPRGDGAGGTLKLRVAAGFGLVVSQEGPQIIARLNTFFGYGAIARLRLVQGPAATGRLPAGIQDWAVSEPEMTGTAIAPGHESPNSGDRCGEEIEADSGESPDTLPVLQRLRAALAARRKRAAGPTGR